MTHDEYGEDTRLPQTAFLQQENARQMPHRQTGPLDAIVPWVIELRVVGTPYLINAPASASMLIGRADTERGYKPEIDLHPYGGHALGVSRRHARLTARNNRITITDIGSANGTYINDHILLRGRSYRVRDRDRLRLGRMDLQVHFVVKPHVHEQTMTEDDMENFRVPQFGRGQRVLVLDDNRDACRVVQQVAQRAGFQVQCVHTAVEAVTAIDAIMPDILILELVLPDASGLDIVSYLRSKHSGRQTPILAVTSAMAGYKIGLAAARGVNRVLGKPFAVEELLQGLQDLSQPVPD